MLRRFSVFFGTVLLLLHTATVSAAQTVGGDFKLTDHHGQPFELQQLRGKVGLLFFGYTWCPTVCPDSLTQMAQVLRELDEQADKVGVLFVTVDPERDTVEKLSQYVPYFNPQLTGLTGTVAQVRQVAQQYRATYALNRKSPDDDQYLVDHSADIYVLDQQGRVASIIPFGMPAQHIVGVVRAMLDDTGDNNHQPLIASAATTQPPPAAAASARIKTADRQQPEHKGEQQGGKQQPLPVFRGDFQPPESFRPKSLQGKPVALEHYSGKPVLINFWASWCPPCRAELPALNRAAEALQADNITTLAVNVGDSEAAVKRFLEDFPIDFPVLLDEPGDSMKQWSIKGMPTTVLLTSAGEVALHITGERDWDHMDILAQIRDLAGE